MPRAALNSSFYNNTTLFERVIPFIGIAVVYLLGINIKLMDVDASQYASISAEMLRTGNYLEVTDNGVNYLDKPPLLFWLSALSMKVFGLGFWQYRLPSVLSTFIGLYSFYGLSNRLYSASTAFYASILLGSCQAWFLINHDVRTDTLLVNSVLFATYMFVAYKEERRAWQFLGLATGLALALMAKGPIGIVAPFAFAIPWLIFNVEYKFLFHYRWILLALLILLFLLPMSYGLYTQWGLEGVKFFYWTQSFGRITGENVWRNDVYFFFLFENMLWAFIPYTIIFIISYLGLWLHSVTTPTIYRYNDVALLSSFTLVYIALAMSRYQLPHYLFVVYPVAALVSVRFLETIINTALIKTLAIFQWVIAVLLVALLGFLLFKVAELELFWWPAIFIPLLIVVLVVFINRKSYLSLLIYSSLIAALVVNTGLNTQMYPWLFQWQAEEQLVEYLLENNKDISRLHSISRLANSSKFRANHVIPDYQQVSDIIGLPSPSYIICKADKFAEIKYLMPQAKILLEKQDFHISMLTPTFLNPLTRNSATETVILVEI